MNSYASKFACSCIGTGDISSVFTLPLTGGHVALVDREGFERFKHLRWRAFPVRKNFCAATGHTPILFLHRLIMEAPKGMQVDHINRNPLDNRRSNLRLATPQQNLYNRRFKTAAHGFIGVWSQTPGLYYGKVMVAGKVTMTRAYPCPVLAAAARDVLAQKLHGDFAVLNFQFVPVQVAA